MNGSLIAVEQCRLLAGDPIISAVKLCSSLHCILYGLRDRNKSVRCAAEEILPPIGGLRTGSVRFHVKSPQSIA